MEEEQKNDGPMKLACDPALFWCSQTAPNLSKIVIDGAFALVPHVEESTLVACLADPRLAAKLKVFEDLLGGFVLRGKDYLMRLHGCPKR